MSVSVATSCSFAMCDPMVVVENAKEPIPFRYILHYIYIYMYPTYLYYIKCTYMYIYMYMWQACPDRKTVFNRFSRLECNGVCVRGSMAKSSRTPGIIKLYQGGYTCAVGTAKADDGANAVVMAALITATIFFSLKVFTMQSKIDFSFLGAGLAVSLLILCLFGLGMMIFGATPSLYYGYCVAGTLIFALYIIFGM